MFLPLFVLVMGCGDDTPQIDYAMVELRYEDIQLIKNRIDAEVKICTTDSYLGYQKNYCFYSVSYMDKMQKHYSITEHHSGAYALEVWAGSYGWSDLDSNLTPLSFVGSVGKCPYRVIMTDDCREKALITVNAALMAFGARPVEGPEK